MQITFCDRHKARDGVQTTKSFFDDYNLSLELLCNEVIYDLISAVDQRCKMCKSACLIKLPEVKLP